MQIKISVVIRVYNEQKHIREVMESIKKQDYPNYEVIVVDSESTDETLSIVKEYPCTVVHIKKKDFNYSYASNVGVNNTNGDLVVFLSGHSVILKHTYFSELIEIFKDEKIGACYGDVVALEDGSIYEKAFNFLGYVKNKILLKKEYGVQLANQIHPGIFSCSNACAKKDLLVKHPFVEELGYGGEDVLFAHQIIQDGYYVAKVPELLVKHSHGSGLFKFLKEIKNWKKMYANVISYIEKETE